MNKDLENWFFPHANKLSKQLGLVEWKGRVPVLVEDAWDFQQLKIEQLEKENNALKKTILKIGDEYKALKMQNESLETWSDHYKNGLTSGEKKLVEENAMMREALEFYADEYSYSLDDYHGIIGEMRSRCILYSDMEERNGYYRFSGKRAREVLEKLTKGAV